MVVTPGAFRRWAGPATLGKGGIPEGAMTEPNWSAGACPNPSCPAYGVRGAPATFFIRADGTIAGDLLGPVSIGLLDKQFEKIAR